MLYNNVVVSNLRPEWCVKAIDLNIILFESESNNITFTCIVRFLLQISMNARIFPMCVRTGAVQTQCRATSVPVTLGSSSVLTSELVSVRQD